MYYASIVQLVAAALTCAACAETAPLATSGASLAAPSSSSTSTAVVTLPSSRGSVAATGPVAATAPRVELTQAEACVLAERSHDMPSAFAKLSAQCALFDSTSHGDPAHDSSTDSEGSGRPIAVGAVQLCALARKARATNAPTAPMLERRCQEARGADPNAQTTATPWVPPPPPSQSPPGSHGVSF